MDQVMNVNDWYLFQGVGNVIGFHRVVGPRFRGAAQEGMGARSHQQPRRIGCGSRMKPANM
jgi:hypothetical protein